MLTYFSILSLSFNVGKDIVHRTGSQIFRDEGHFTDTAKKWMNGGIRR